MVDVQICSAAEDEFTNALLWYAERDVDVANRFDLDFAAAIVSIASDPERLPSCDDRHRFFLMRGFPYQIIFRVETECVIVIAVAHAKRDPGYWSER